MHPNPPIRTQSRSHPAEQHAAYRPAISGLSLTFELAWAKARLACRVCTRLACARLACRVCTRLACVKMADRGAEETQLDEALSSDTQSVLGQTTLPSKQDSRLLRAYENVMRNPKLEALLDKWVASQDEMLDKWVASQDETQSKQPGPHPPEPRQLTPRRSHADNGAEPTDRQEDQAGAASSPRSSRFNKPLDKQVTIDITK